ncbi:uncharacterized protein KY384_001369 [Bacidia gigantensis]|uniref:uncharacterized protein n=1 Tax=Bacidia gigantensis TaxID=2732470 RepID=UPI001D03CEB7|nr:uncharacterized protein KY384_001369 [Bacidia gigantensis]KAG8533629.1 hypothetical protein KY384_001369 [Bacidia gigantensis]
MQYTIQTLVVAALTGLSLAADVCQHHANASPTPSGNPIHQPPKGFPVPAGKNFEITWTPSSTDKISIALLRGPADHAEEYQCIANSIDNSGSYTWVVPSSLDADTSNYGLKIIDDSTGDYQYSDLFGISNTAKKSSSSTTPTPSHTKTPKESKPHKPTPSYPAGNGTHPLPTGTHKSKPSHSGTAVSSKAHNKTKTAEAKTSTYLPSSSVVQSASQGQETSVQVVGGGASGGGEATATVGAPTTTPTGTLDSGVGRVGMSAGLLAGVGALAVFVL